MEAVMILLKNSRKLPETPNVKILIHERNSGMGNAIKTGLISCHGALVITMDADLTFRPVDVAALIEKYRETNADCVSGSPYLKKASWKK